MSIKARHAALLKVKTSLEDKHGPESVMLLTDMPRRPFVSSGSLALDFALGGGLPSDRIIEVAGTEGTGKTTLALLAMQQFLDAQPDRGAMILDLEHKMSVSWVEQLIGAERMARVILAWPDTAEQATDIYTEAVKSGQVCFVLFDSIAGAPTQRVTGKSAESGNVGGNSLAISRFASSAAILSQKHNCLTFCVNQVRDDMAGYHRLITPGGRALKSACVIRIHLKQGKGRIDEDINGEKITIGYVVVAKVIKNQQAVEGRTAWYWFFNVPTQKWGFGVDTIDEIVRLSVLTKIVTRAGAWYSHHLLPNGKIQSLDRLTTYIKEHPEMRKDVAEEVKARLADVAADVAPISDPDSPIVEPDGVGEIFLRGESGDER